MKTFYIFRKGSEKVSYLPQDVSRAGFMQVCGIRFPASNHCATPRGNEIYRRESNLLTLRKSSTLPFCPSFQREFLRKGPILGKLPIDLAQRKGERRGGLYRKRVSCFQEDLSSVRQDCFLDTTGSQDQCRVARIRALPFMVNTSLGRLEKQSGFGHISFL